MVIAPEGQWRAQLPQATPSVRTTQLDLIHTAWPICIDDFLLCRPGVWLRPDKPRNNGCIPGGNDRAHSLIRVASAAKCRSTDGALRWDMQPRRAGKPYTGR